MHLIFYLFLMLLFSADALAGDYSTRSVNNQNMEHRINKLEKDLYDLQVNVYQDNNVAPVKSSKVKYSSADLELRVAELEELVRNIFGKIENLEFKIHNLNASVDEQNNILKNQNKRIDDNAHIKEEPGSMENLLTKDPVEKPEEIPPLSNNNRTVDSEYNDAYQLLRVGNTVEAEVAFTNFIDKYPDNKLTSNAYYWLGEKYFAEGDYRQAAIKFLRGYEKFPDSNKAADNLLKLSISLSSLNKNKEACTSFKKLFKEFPNTTPAILKRAQEETKRLGCK